MESGGYERACRAEARAQKRGPSAPESWLPGASAPDPVVTEYANVDGPEVDEVCR
jgi:hypothetical protein